MVVTKAVHLAVMTAAATAAHWAEYWEGSLVDLMAAPMVVSKDDHSAVLLELTLVVTKAVHLVVMTAAATAAHSAGCSARSLVDLMAAPLVVSKDVR